LIASFEVTKFIDQLNTNKSAGVNGKGPKVIKLCKVFLIQPLTALINNCISQGKFPDMLKLANVVPLFKGDAMKDPNNYRPISPLPTISKLFEKHIANQLHIIISGNYRFTSENSIRVSKAPLLSNCTYKYC